MTGRKISLIRMVAERLVLVLALVLALSFPALSSAVDTTDINAVAAAHQTLGALATPDTAFLSPAVETTSEYDRSRTGASPAILDTPVDVLRRAVTVSGIFHIAPGTTIPGCAVVLPPGCGPPSVS